MTMTIAAAGHGVSIALTTTTVMAAEVGHRAIIVSIATIGTTRRVIAMTGPIATTTAGVEKFQAKARRLTM